METETPLTVGDEAGAALAAELAVELEPLLPHPATTRAATTTAAAPPARNLLCLKVTICVSYIVDLPIAVRRRVTYTDARTRSSFRPPRTIVGACRAR
jgi:hypothetical protein